jgi:hypothetical protein
MFSPSEAADLSLKIDLGELPVDCATSDSMPKPVSMSGTERGRVEDTEREIEA